VIIVIFKTANKSKKNLDKSLGKNQSGQALVEMAIILPILLILIFGIIEYGRGFAAYLAVTTAAREGARIATVGGSDNDISAAVTLRTSAMLLDSTKLTISISPTAGSRIRGSAVTIEVTYLVPMYDPVFTTLIGTNMSVKGKTVMRVE